MQEIGIEDARKILGQLVDQAADGNVIYLTRHGRRYAALVPLAAPTDPVLPNQAGAALAQFYAVQGQV